MHKSATKCNETLGKWYTNKHGASKIIDTLETYQLASSNEELGEMASSFYRGLYTSKGIQGLEEVLNSVPVKVSSRMNEVLESPFGAAKMKKALLEMYPTKALGPDVFPAHFFQRN
jgi:hypothetical protein